MPSFYSLMRILPDCKRLSLRLFLCEEFFLEYLFQLYLDKSVYEIWFYLDKSVILYQI
jgi:hypothetical protein